MYLISSKDSPKLDASQYSPDFCDFVDKCLHKDPSKRQSCSTLLNHPFIAKIDSEECKAEFRRMVNSKKNIPMNELMKMAGNKK